MTTDELAATIYAKHRELILAKNMADPSKMGDWSSLPDTVKEFWIAYAECAVQALGAMKE